MDRVGAAIRNVTLATGTRTRSISRPCVNAMILALHALTLLQYDSIVLLQHNVRPVSPDLEALFTCGQLKRMLLTTSGGMAVARPSEQAARAATIALDVLAKLSPGDLPRTSAGVPWTLNFPDGTQGNATRSMSLGECADAALKVVWDSVRDDDIATAPSEESYRLTNAGRVPGRQELYLDSCKYGSALELFAVCTQAVWCFVLHVTQVRCTSDATQK
eukprot:m.44958 g.44958  ORF g.44958 m.44958 type:complete len:218 (-) comp15105_c0_seq15:180-833(-)